jgi:hypothetical protein
LNPRFIGLFKILEKIGPVAYKLEFTEELTGVHNVFRVLNLKKCLIDESLTTPLDDIQVDEKLNFRGEPIEIVERQVKRWM